MAVARTCGAAVKSCATRGASSATAAYCSGSRRLSCSAVVSSFQSTFLHHICTLLKWITIRSSVCIDAHALLIGWGKNRCSAYV